MEWLLENGLHPRFLDHLPSIHDANAVGDVGKHTWKRYKEKYEKRKPQQIAIPMPKTRTQQEQYVG
jgi:hypothetical protein